MTITVITEYRPDGTVTHGVRDPEGWFIYDVICRWDRTLDAFVIQNKGASLLADDATVWRFDHLNEASDAASAIVKGKAITAWRKLYALAE